MHSTIVELFKEDMKFSSGHFTIFSKTEREPLHGHNFFVHLGLELVLREEEGLNFDYRFYKQQIRTLCRELNQFFLLPTQSPFLRIEEHGLYYHVFFDQDCLFFLKKDVKLLPLSNITVEELSAWFVLRLTQEEDELKQQGVQRLWAKVFSGPGQCASSTWIISS